MNTSCNCPWFPVASRSFIPCSGLLCVYDSLPSLSLPLCSASSLSRLPLSHKNNITRSSRTHNKHTHTHTHTQRQGQGATAGQADRCHPRCRRQHRRTSEVSPLRGVRERRGRRGSRHAVSPLLPQEVRILACPWQSRDGFFSTFEGTQRCGGEGKQGGQEKRDRGGGSKGGTIGRSSDQQRDL